MNGRIAMNNNHRHHQEDCDPILELIPDYAFGLADSEEVRRVEAALPDCPEASAQLTDFRKLQAELRIAVPPIDPPPELEARLMAAITVTKKPVQARRLGVRIRRIWIAAVAAAVLLIATNLYWALRVNELTRRQAELQAQVVSGDRATFILNNTEFLRWVRLPPSQQNPDTTAWMMWNAQAEVGLLYARNFPKLAQGTIYQLWLTEGDEKISAGTFQVDSNGTGALIFHMTEPIDHYTWARITTEPASGSQAPSERTLVTGKLTT